MEREIARVVHSCTIRQRLPNLSAVTEPLLCIGTHSSGQLHVRRVSAQVFSLPWNISYIAEHLS